MIVALRYASGSVDSSVYAPDPVRGCEFDFIATRRSVTENEIPSRVYTLSLFLQSRLLANLELAQLHPPDGPQLCLCQAEDPLERPGLIAQNWIPGQSGWCSGCRRALPRSFTPSRRIAVLE